MDKLSELSKPVAWKLHHHDRYYFEENADVVAIAESMGQAKGDTLYSQEYVSALIQRAERLDSILTESVQALKAVEQRNAELEAKLATPVRLPDIRSDDYHETGWFQHMKYYRDVERSIRAAGFAVGDE
ncbi:TPA: hypothetical protein SMF52_003716 [Serratia marcescens]|nr:hypothetical protein [Serratia marcescens]HEJ7022437.1 hypothetical protein [Serratia marcescens]